MEDERKKLILMLLVFLILLTSHFIVGRNMYIIGGRKACSNSDSILIEGFECEKIIRQPRTTRSLLNLWNGSLK